LPPSSRALPADPPGPGSRLGRFTIESLLGSGATGQVFRALDERDGQPVALKVLRPELLRNAEVVYRFKREGRLLSQLSSPWIVGLVEVGLEGDFPYMAMEFVEGRGLDAILRDTSVLEEKEALRIAADVARGLAGAHAVGIIHRDIKPANILLVDDVGGVSGARRARLCDFGVARHVDGAETLALTGGGALIGTPIYMAPEQARGEAVDARTDVYALGVTLYRMLVGRPPFVAPDSFSVLTKHLNEQPVPVNRIRPELSDAVSQLVDRTLEKDPGRRFADGGELLDALERLLRGDVGRIEVHPQLPENIGDILTYPFQWELAAAPSRLWPLVSNTDRLNRAIGLGAVSLSEGQQLGPGAPQGQLRVSGMDLVWQEHPYEWVEGRRFGVVREFSSGPFRWFRSVVELEASGAGGTLLSHTIQVIPNGMLGRAAAATEIGFRFKRSLSRVYQRIDQILKVGVETSRVSSLPLELRVRDPFEEGERLGSEARQLLSRGIERALARQGDPEVLECLELFLQESPPQEAGRIRPLVFARRFGFSEEAVVRSMFVAAREGVLELQWDLLCPVCRVPSGLLDSLKHLKEHAWCRACDLSYKTDFSGSIELIFRAHPRIRSSDTGLYCMGGPGRFPHVVAQVRLRAGEAFQFELSLEEGRYRIAGPQLPRAVVLQVRPDVLPSRLDLPLGTAEAIVSNPSLRTGRQLIALQNESRQELLVRIERMVPRDEALTAARAACHPLFRELFPQEVLAPGFLVGVAQVVALLTRLPLAAAGGDLEAEGASWRRLNAHVQQLVSLAGKQGGAAVRIQGDGVLATFTDPGGALEVALALIEGEETPPGVAIHAGPAMAVTLNERLDYFGETLRTLARMGEQVEAGRLLLSEAASSDPSVRSRLETLGGTSIIEGTRGEVFLHVRVGEVAAG
jgi:serine/threonine protein kinase